MDLSDEERAYLDSSGMPLSYYISVLRKLLDERPDKPARWLANEFRRVQNLRNMLDDEEVLPVGLFSPGSIRNGADETGFVVLDDNGDEQRQREGYGISI